MRSVKRTVYWVVWDKALQRWSCVVNGEKMNVGHTSCFLTKREFIAAVDIVARQHPPSERIAKNKDGKIGKGKNSRVTYGDDPRRSKG